MSQECATIVKVRVLDDYQVELTFSDGVHGVINLANRIVGRGGIFEPLENLQFFRQVKVDRELGALVWPNGADICPDLLYSWVAGEPVTIPQPEKVSL